MQFRQKSSIFTGGFLVFAYNMRFFFKCLKYVLYVLVELQKAHLLMKNVLFQSTGKVAKNAKHYWLPYVMFGHFHKSTSWFIDFY